jgi:hypothetical protein
MSSHNHSREDFHSLLAATTGAEHIYYQPPANVRMIYPCIEYHDQPWVSKFANNKAYIICRHYQVTVIDPMPNNPWIMTLASEIPMCTHSRHYTSDGLNHDVLDIYY